MTPKEMIEVLQAFESGKAIQHCDKQYGHTWLDDEQPSWNFCYYDYRVKQEPLTVWLNKYETHFGWAYETKEVANSVCQPGGTPTKFIQVDE